MSAAAEKLVAWRLGQQLSQREAAARIGVSQPAYQAYETGGVPGIFAALAIERATAGAVQIREWAEPSARDRRRRPKRRAARARAS